MIKELFKTCNYNGRLYHLWSDGSLTEGFIHEYVNFEDAPKEVKSWVYSQEATYRCNVEKGCWEFTGFIHKGHTWFTVESIVLPSLGFPEECVAVYNGNKTIPFE